MLLSKTELKWLRGEINVSRLFEYQIRSRIKKKVQTLIDLELPLLIQTDFINYSNNTEPGRDLETGTTKTMAKALVRQRSRVQIPAKAYPFLETEEEMKILTI